VRNTSRRNGVSNVYQLIGDYTNPILKPEAAQAVKKAGEIASTGVTYPTPSNQCWPGGVPFIFWNIGMQIIQQPDKIAILDSNDHEVRHIRLNQPHREPVTPSWYGDSVGRYEGDTLVIETVGVRIGPFAMVDMYGTPHSPALHVVERYRLLDYEAAREAEERGERGNFRLQGSDPGLAPDPNYKGKGLHLEFTVEDDDVFTTPQLINARSPRWANGRNLSAPRTGTNTTPERTLRCRLRTSRISEPNTPPFAEGLLL